MTQSVAIFCILMYGMLISLMLASKLPIQKKLNLTDNQAGMLFSAFMITGAVSVLILSPMIDLFGHKVLIASGFTAIVLALLLIGSLRSYRIVLLGHALLSTGAMAIISAGNTMLPHVLFGGKNPPAAVNMGNVFYGAGAFFVSLTIGYVISRTSFRKAFGLYSLLFIIPPVLALSAAYPSINTGFSYSDLLTLITNPFVLIAILANFFASGVENGVGAWLTTFLNQRGMTEKSANMMLGLFFVSIMVSRLGSALLVTIETIALSITICAAIALLMLLLLMLNRSKAAAIAAFLVLGLTLGPNVPNIFGYLFSSIDPRLHGSAFGICFTAGLTGAGIFPGITSLLTRKIRLQKAFVVNLTGAAILLAASMLIY